MSFFHYSQINCINEVRNFLLLIVYLKIFGIQKKGLVLQRRSIELRPNRSRKPMAFRLLRAMALQATSGMDQPISNARPLQSGHQARPFVPPRHGTLQHRCCCSPGDGEIYEKNKLLLYLLTIYSHHLNYIKYHENK